jgi:hypothetical protein
MSPEARSPPPKPEALPRSPKPSATTPGRFEFRDPHTTADMILRRVLFSPRKRENARRDISVLVVSGSFRPVWPDARASDRKEHFS